MLSHNDTSNSLADVSAGGIPFTPAMNTRGRRRAALGRIVGAKQRVSETGHHGASGARQDATRSREASARTDRVAQLHVEQRSSARGQAGRLQQVHGDSPVGRREKPAHRRAVSEDAPTAGPDS